jgi:hypothetical protein
MTGQEFYTLYEQAHNETNCEVDSWDSLDDIDKERWDRIAELAEEAVLGSDP